VAPSGGSPSSVSLDWNSFGQVEKITYPAGVERRLDYDGAGRLKDDSTTKLGSGVIARRETEYNLDGTPKKLTVTQPGNSAAGIYTYQYDKGQRLIGFTGTGASTYKYDTAGNRTEENGQVSVFDERNRLTSKGGTVYMWSARGNRTGVVGQAVFTFDALDRQTGVGGATYTYDSLDRVIGRSVSGVTKFFNYAGFETDPTSDGTSSWSRSPGGSVLGQTRAGTSVLVGTERHGDVAWTLNPTTGTIADSTVSDPYGKALSVTGTPGQVGFQGDWTDPLTGLVWMAARWYDTQTATFTSRDTYPGEIGAGMTLNRYLYALGSPLAYFDPTGRFSIGEVQFEANQFYVPNVDNGVATTAVGQTDSGNTYAFGAQGNTTTGTGNTYALNSSGNVTAGNLNLINGTGNVTDGDLNVVVGSMNVTAGNNNQISGVSNLTIGSSNVVAGNTNFTLGSQDVVTGSGNLTIGSKNRVTGNSNIVFSSGVTQKGNNLFPVNGQLPPETLFGSGAIRLLLASWMISQTNRGCGAAVAALAGSSDPVGYQAMCQAVKQSGTSKALLKLTDIKEQRSYSEGIAQQVRDFEAFQLAYLSVVLGGVYRPKPLLRITATVERETLVIPRAATAQPKGGNGAVLRDGAGTTPTELAASTGGPTGGSRAGQAGVRKQLIEDSNGQFTCWRCGQQTADPANMHLGHRNVPTSQGGNLSPYNVCLEGAACNLSAGSRGLPSPGMSCVQRGSCGAPYGKTN
jgi:RHS repeat-associated protein